MCWETEVLPLIPGFFCFLPFFFLINFAIIKASVSYAMYDKNDTEIIGLVVIASGLLL